MERRRAKQAPHGAERWPVAGLGTRRWGENRRCERGKVLECNDLRNDLPRPLPPITVMLKCLPPGGSHWPPPTRIIATLCALYHIVVPAAGWGAVGPF